MKNWRFFDRSPIFQGVEGLLTGAFMVLNLTALFLIISRTRRTIHESDPACGRGRQIWAYLRVPLIPGSIFLLLTVSAHWVCTLIRALQAVSIMTNGSSGSSVVEFFKDISQPTVATMAFFTVLSIPVADILLIWRLWIVSNRSKAAIAFPLVASLGFGGIGVKIIVSIATAKPGADIFAPEIYHWIILVAAITACVNIYCSGLLVFYIWRINSATRSYTKTDMSPILVIIIESALIHTLWSIFLVVAYQSKSGLSCMAIDNSGAVSGISFMLITVRVALGRDTTPALSMGELASTPSDLFKADNRDPSRSTADDMIHSGGTILTSFTTFTDVSVGSAASGQALSKPTSPTILRARLGSPSNPTHRSSEVSNTVV